MIWIFATEIIYEKSLLSLWRFLMLHHVVQIMIGNKEIDMLQKSFCDRRDGMNVYMWSKSVQAVRLEQSR